MSLGDENISYLIEHGLSTEDIQRYIKNGISLDELCAAVEGIEARGESPSEEEPPKELQPLNMISAPELQRAKLPPVRFLVEGMLPDGTSLLTAASKIGKSWMVLDLGLCIAAGGQFLSHKTNRGRTLSGA